MSLAEDTLGALSAMDLSTQHKRTAVAEQLVMMQSVAEPGA